MEVYAFSHQTAVVQESASGGAFSAIAAAFFATYATPQKVVFGVTMNAEAQVVYEPAYTLEECVKFRGSKYVRSTMRGIPEAVAAHLQQGYAVLFVGTPCFVYAVKNYLIRQSVSTDNLLCVDLICHGTPASHYWEAYKQWLNKKYRSPLTHFRFRTHLEGRGPYTAVATFANGKEAMGTLETALFNRLFLRHYTITEGCFSCRFASLERQGDITIGDFWGIEKVMPTFTSGKAASEILVNTPQGQAVVRWMQENAVGDLQVCTNMAFLHYQNNLQRPTVKAERYDEFQRDFRNKGFAYVVRKYAQYDLLHRIKYTLFKR